MVLTAFSVAIASCGIPMQDEPKPLTEGYIADFIAEDATSTTTTTVAVEASRPVVLYVFQDAAQSSRLRFIERRISEDAGVRGLLEALFDFQVSDTDGPSSASFRSAIPRSATIRSVAVNGDTLTLDTSGLFGESGIQGTGLVEALAQIVWTATQGEGISAVQFLSDGEPIAALAPNAVALERPVTRSDYVAVS